MPKFVSYISSALDCNIYSFMCSLVRILLASLLFPAIVVGWQHEPVAS